MSSQEELDRIGSEKSDADPLPVRRVRARLPAPAFADSTWVHAVIGAPVGASLAFVLEAPPRGSLEHLIVGAVAGAMFGIALGTFRPRPVHRPPEDTSEYEAEQDPQDHPR